jgi:hypothetical protein
MQRFKYTIFSFSFRIRQSYNTLHSVDISQATYKFYIILDTFYNFHGSHITKT